ncbi:hypothetical protein BKA60DRAFT_589054 [Fusarium oxysporum]|nr:hypothetical protein BKA60DRAFT_589054 [Fusarium oxysporum]
MRTKRRPKKPDPVYLASQGRLHERKISPMPALTTIQFADESIAALFHHARQHTLEDFLQTSDSIDFWFQFILPASYSVHAIRHALCALGGAHRFFLGSRVGSITLLIYCAYRGRSHPKLQLRHCLHTAAYDKKLGKHSTDCPCLLHYLHLH